MFCTKCGVKIPDDSVFCENCGARVQIDEAEVTVKNTNEEIHKTSASVEIKQAEEPVKILNDDKLRENNYNEGIRLLQEAEKINDVAAAQMIFVNLKDYKDSKEKAAECKEKFSEMMYLQAVDAFNSAEGTEGLRTAKEYFQRLGDYKDSKELLKKCEDKLQNEVNEEKYNEAVRLLNNYNDDVNIGKALKNLRSLGDYRDSAELIAQGENKLKDFKYYALLRSKNNRTPQTDLTGLVEGFKKLEGYKDSEKLANECMALIRDKQKENEAREKRKKNRIIICGVACAAVIAIIIAYKPLKTASENKRAYEDAVTLYKKGSYEDAAKAFERLGDYKDSVQKISDCYDEIYQSYLDTGIESYNRGDYSTAVNWFNRAAEVNNSAEIEEWKEKCNEGVYQYALSLYNDGSYNDAISAFSSISGYKDADEKAQEANNRQLYVTAIECYNNGDYENALVYFNQITGFEDVDSYIEKISTKAMLEDCKQAYIEYLSTEHTYGIYVGEDLDYYLYDFDNNGIPELFTEEYLIYPDGVPDRVCVVLTYENGSLTTLYKEIVGFGYQILSNTEGKIFFRETTLDAGFENIYRGVITGGKFDFVAAYSFIYPSTAPGDYGGNPYGNNFYDIGIDWIDFYDGNDFSAINNYG